MNANRFLHQQLKHGLRRNVVPTTVSKAGQETFIAWPGWKHLAESVTLAIVFAAWFGAIYATTDYVTTLRTARIRVYLDAELAIPFVPATVVLYMSIYPLFWLGPFVLRTRRELRALVKSMGLVTFIGGIGFLLIPAEVAFASPATVPAPWAGLYALADELNLQHNLVPSLHVALAILCVDVFACRGGIIVQLLLWSLGMAIALSTVLTHQHHMLDVVAGGSLAMIVARVVYPRLAGD